MFLVLGLFGRGNEWALFQVKVGKITCQSLHAKENEVVSCPNM